MERQIFDEMAKAQSTHWWFLARKEILRTIIARLELPKHARILECGAGTGSNLDMLSAFGELHACEADRASREHCVSNGWLVTECRLPEGVATLPDMYDLICLFDVLEHIEDDETTVQAISRKLRPGGYLLLCCPAYQSFYGAYDEDLGHFRRYTATSLAKLIGATDLQVKRKGYFNTVLFPLFILARLLETFGISTRKSALKVPRPIINNFLFGLFYSESWYARYFLFPFGVSAVVVARRSK